MMIEITMSRGEKKSLRKEDIRELTEINDERYPSIKCEILLFDGRKIECKNKYSEIKKLFEVNVAP